MKHNAPHNFIDYDLKKCKTSVRATRPQDFSNNSITFVLHFVLRISLKLIFSRNDSYTKIKIKVCKNMFEY